MLFNFFLLTKQFLKYKKRVFGDEHFFFEGDDGSPKYEDVDEKWDRFVEWLEKVRERNRLTEGFKDSRPDRVGGEVIKWAKEKDAYAIYIITKFNWVEFRDTYLLPSDCPEIVLEFIRAIMHNKMTEKQMWGTDEDRKPTGKLIIFDKNLMDKIESNPGELPVEYCPIKTREFGEKSKEK